MDSVIDALTTGWIHRDDLADLPQLEWSIDDPDHPVKFHTHILSSRAWTLKDDFTAQAINAAADGDSDSDGRHHEHLGSHRIGDMTVHRFRPLLGGVRVHGADRIFVNDREGWIGARVSRLDIGDARALKRREVMWGMTSEEAVEFARGDGGDHHRHMFGMRKSKLERRAHGRKTFADVNAISEPVYFAILKDVSRWNGLNSLALASLSSSSSTTMSSNSSTSTDDHDLFPAYRVVDLTQPSNDRYVRYVHAETGQILATIPLVHMAEQGLVFQERQIVRKLPGDAPVLTELLDVKAPTTSNGGKGIRGKDFRSLNTCLAWRCANGTGRAGNRTGLDGTCNDEGSICVDLPDEYDPATLALPPGAHTVSSYFAADGKYIDLYRNWTEDGFPNGRIIVQWTEATVFGPRLERPNTTYPASNPPAIVWGSTTDFTKYSGQEFDDEFAELQGYHSLSLHMKFMKELLKDPNFCLRGQGQNCTDVDPVSNFSSTPWTRQLRFTVNYVNSAPSSFDGVDFLDQLEMGRGKNVTNPIQFTGVQPYGEAFYSGSGYQPPLDPSNATLDADWMGNCTDLDCTMIDSTPFAFIALGQNLRYDWAINQCIVFHELTHVFVDKYIPDLPSYAWTARGLQSDPGAMNEAWADYFAAIHCGVSNFYTTYNGQPRRDLNNDYDCSYMVGEIHNGKYIVPNVELIPILDGQIFSGAFWTIRKLLPDESSQTDFDRLILTAISMGKGTDDFSSQFRLVHSLMKSHPLPAISSLSDRAWAEFSKREFNCSRSTEYFQTMDSTFVLPSAGLTSVRVATLPNQLIITPRGPDWGFTLKWKQWYNSPFLGPSQLGYGRTRIKFLISHGCPLFLSPVNQTSINSFASTVDTPEDEIKTSSGPFRSFTSSNPPPIIGPSFPVYGLARCPTPSGGTVDVPIQWFDAELDVVKYGYGSVSVTFKRSNELGFAAKDSGDPSTVGADGKAKVYVWMAHGISASITMYSSDLKFTGWTRVLYQSIGYGGAISGGIGLLALLILTIAGIFGIFWLRKLRRQSESIPEPSQTVEPVVQITLEKENDKPFQEESKESEPRTVATTTDDSKTGDIEPKIKLPGEVSDANLSPSKETSTKKEGSVQLLISSKISSDTSPAQGVVNLSPTREGNNNAVPEREKDISRLRAAAITSTKLHLFLASIFLGGCAVAAFVADIYVPARELGVEWAIKGMFIVLAYDWAYIAALAIIIYNQPRSSTTHQNDEGVIPLESLPSNSASTSKAKSIQFSMPPRSYIQWPLILFASSTLLLLGGVIGSLVTSSLYPMATTEAAAGFSTILFIVGFTARFITHFTLLGFLVRWSVLEALKLKAGLKEGRK
ncbi:hypothetical protein HDU97_005200 [Phlyctochytrium planicorne]|nr:hypothetical protein HDU97_005200 [Phlyctochytrium planicorne]